MCFKCHFFKEVSPCPRWAPPKHNYVKITWGLVPRPNSALHTIGSLKKNSTYLFRGREREGETEEEKHWYERNINSCLLYIPNQRPNPQSRHVPWLGIELVTFLFAVRCPTYWTTPARVHTVGSLYLNLAIPITHFKNTLHRNFSAAMFIHILCQCSFSSSELMSLDPWFPLQDNHMLGILWSPTYLTQTFLITIA